MQNNIAGRPQTSKYRNQSHIQFGDQTLSKQLNSQSLCLKRKKRPQSYRNISKISEFMNDNYQPKKEILKIHYTNVIQNRDQSYEVPKVGATPKNQQSQQFQNFFEKTGYKMYKPIDQFTQYTDLLKKNSNLLRRGQFNTPLQNEFFNRYKNSQNSSKISYKTSKYYTKFKKNTIQARMGNTISASLSESIKEKKTLQKQKKQFVYLTQKYIKPLNKTFLQYANEYDDFFGKEKQSKQKVSLSNAMNRVLTMQIMGKQISNMTQLYV